MSTSMWNPHFGCKYYTNNPDHSRLHLAFLFYSNIKNRSVRRKKEKKKHIQGSRIHTKAGFTLKRGYSTHHHIYIPAITRNMIILHAHIILRTHLHITSIKNVVTTKSLIIISPLCVYLDILQKNILF